jgi:hypothetical protein
VCDMIEYPRREDVKLDSDAYFKTMARTSQFSVPKSLQLRVLRICSDEDENIRVGVFPEREEILIRRLGLGGVVLHRVGTRRAEAGQRPQGKFPPSPRWSMNF